MEKDLNAEELGEYYGSLLEKYPIVSIEDPFDQDDWAAYSLFNKKLRRKSSNSGGTIYS